MRYVEGFQDPDAAAYIVSTLHETNHSIRGRGRPIRIMEVCGTHSMAIARYGIRNILPEGVELISGPGCPVCVTAPGYIDAAMELANRGVIICTFGDLLRVPGSKTSLAQARTRGAEVHVLYSPEDALSLAEKNPRREVVFLAVGFETTSAPFAALVDLALKDKVDNLSFLTAFKMIPPAIFALLENPGIQIDAFLLPAHVSAIIGVDPYRTIVERYKTCGVIAGFEPLDILYGLQEILRQLSCDERSLVNQYRRVVREGGNRKALALMGRVFKETDVEWRGIGIIGGSGMTLRADFERFDACKRYGIEMETGFSDSRCRCGEVLRGVIRPADCPLFGLQCTPEEPVGPCMVSSEGSCAAVYKFERHSECLTKCS